MKIYNTFSQEKETLNLDQNIKIYVCGITPYDATHLGHAFTFLAYDVLVRYLRFVGARVTYVQNVTDIDDPLFEKARELKVDWKELGDRETEKHIQNMDALNTLRPDRFIKVTEHIDQIIEINKVLVEKNLAYVNNCAVYFEVKKYKKFGRLSKLRYPQMLKLANERGNFPGDPNKKDSLDFVLWQTSKPDEPSWDSPWGKGRPGWHIECSAMSLKYLGPTITIHGGGEDLIFPHHEAEIAVSENITNKKFVKTWMHTSSVYMHKEKMSKSFGNTVFIADLLKTFESYVVRLHLISIHYRKPLHCSLEKINQWEPIYKLLKQKSANGKNLQAAELKRSIPQFFEAMDDDLNIPGAIEELINYANSNEMEPSVVKTCMDVLGIS